MKPVPFAILLLSSISLAQGQISQECAVIDGAGSRSAGGSLISVAAVAQPGTVSVTTGGNYTHYAGFLGCAILRPNLDTDGDGVADEIDVDNDNDGLTDLDEVSGGLFTPTTPTDLNNADSDGDGTTDGAEATAGTNPDDINAFLHITDLALGGPATISWEARGGKTYIIRYDDDLIGGSSGVISNVTAVGGSAPWFETTATGDDPNPASAPHRTYSIEVLP